MTSVPRIVPERCPLMSNMGHKRIHESKQYTHINAPVTSESTQ
jgi:hypothetical protein